MESKVQEYFSEKTLVFRERRLPEPATPIGYAALIETYKLCVLIFALKHEGIDLGVLKNN